MCAQLLLSALGRFSIALLLPKHHYVFIRVLLIIFFLIGKSAAPLAKDGNTQYKLSSAFVYFLVRTKHFRSLFVIKKTYYLLFRILAHNYSRQCLAYNV